jgi:hypothetical protein
MNALYWIIRKRNSFPVLHRELSFSLRPPPFGLTTFESKGQDPVFSQYYLSPLQLNPGLAGLTEDARLTANYGINIQALIMPIGLMRFPMISFSPGKFWGRHVALSDDAGDGILKTIKGAGIFSYRVQLNDHLFAKMGAEVAVVQSTLNWNKLLFGDQIDDLEGSMSPGGIPYPTDETARTRIAWSIPTWVSVESCMEKISMPASVSGI